jgi:transposase
MNRPSVDPEVLVRMLLVGYCFGIRSERWLCEEVHLNLAYRWFCRLDLSDRVPDHSTFSKNRHGRFRDSELLRHLFEMTVARCIEEGLVSGERMAVDASLIGADANKQNSTPKEEWDWGQIDPADAPRAVREYLDTLDEAAFGAASEVQPKAAQTVLRAVSNGELTPTEGASVIGLVEGYRRAAEAADLEARIEALEARR